MKPTFLVLVSLPFALLCVGLALDAGSGHRPRLGVATGGAVESSGDEHVTGGGATVRGGAGLTAQVPQPGARGAAR